MAGVYRQTLSSLQPDTQNSLIVGVIINSTGMKAFESKNSRFNNGERGVWSFTLRDSFSDFINATAWGSVGYIRDLSSNLHVGDVVEVINAKVVLRREDDRNEMFVPAVSSRYTLTLNEGVSDIQKHTAPNRSKYEELLNLPTKHIGNLKRLDEVLKNIEVMNGESVDILVVLITVGESRDIITKDGRAVVCRDIEVTDGSVDATVSLRLWDPEWVDRSGRWIPRQTTLYLADASIAFNSFKKMSVINIARKTLITENPNIPEASAVRASARRIPIEYLSSSEPSTSSEPIISTVMTVEQILQKLNERKPHNVERIQFTTIIHALVKYISLEGTGASMLSMKCAMCKKTVSENQDSCMNLECPYGNGTRTPLNVATFNLKVSISDHTGHLIGCRLTGATAERILKCSVKQFKAMSQEQRADLKWRYTMEKCEIHLQIIGPSTTWPRPMYNVLYMEPMQKERADRSGAKASR